MKNQVCTEEQMNELINLGVNIDGASCIERVFTIADMLDRMPETLIDQDMTFNLQIYKEGGWHCRYYCIDYDVFILCSHRPLLKDAVYDVFLELAKEGKLIEK